MAKFTPGPLAGAISGSVGGSTFSHNRYGPYIRRRAIPVTSTTEEALAAKARFTSQSQAFSALTAAQKLGWEEYALHNPVTDALGMTQPLTANVAFISLNTRLLLIGEAPITVPPILTNPAPLLTLSQTADIGIGTFELAYTATPLGATGALYIWAVVVSSSGVKWVENALRFVGISAKAQASPFDHEALVTARFGVPQVGQTVHVRVHVIDTTNGLVSAPLRTSTVVVTT